MKNIIYKIKQAAPAALALLLASSCGYVLDEQPRSFFEPGFFKTEAGVYGGLTSMYAHLRYIYGQAYYYNSCQTGTDEATYAQSADGNFKDADLSGVGSLTPSSSRSDVLWGAAFPNINTASGIIENAEEAGIDNSLIAEARFFRAFDYFLLVQTFGGVPLDLGAGELKFNTSPSRVSTRNTVPEVYTKAIFPDLLTAVADLPEVGRLTGAATKTVARLTLAKAYLTYGWWLDNPNNIPTYPECSRVDPDGKTSQWYYQQAYDIATTAINNPGPFGLQETFYMVNLGPNDRNNEILLYADHTQESEYYNGGSLTYGSGGAPDNFAGWMMTWNYTTMTSSIDGNWASSSKINPVQRAATQPLGRPWTRMCPTINVVRDIFADKTNDSRYDGTFTTVYRANWPKGGNSAPFVYNANDMVVYPGGAILSFLGEEPETAITYPSGQGNGNIGAGTLPGRSDFVVAPSGISRIVYPGLWKLGPYRTDNGDGLGQPNAGSTRPYNISKFSELYLVAAEAAVKGASTTSGMTALDLVNVLRARAGKWSYSNADDAAKTADFSSAMTSATPATITIDYILDERSREFYGEGYRWFDLARTQTWKQRAGTYEICGASYGDHTPQTVTRDIADYLYLRPIPTGQLEGLEMTADEKAAYQNPGY